PIDDLSQEIAAQAAGVELVLNEGWLKTMEEFFKRRSRVMPPNNKKQAMLPSTAEVIDNPIGTACGFALDIGRARFFFTPGVPRELRRMLEEQIIPRLLAKSGLQAAIHLKRFHSYGLGESHVDQLLTGVEELAADGSVKLGFRAHYPQLETKLTVRGKDMDDIRRKLAPVETEVRKRMGNFIMAEDEQTPDGRDARARGADRSRRRPGPDRLRRHYLPGHRDRGRHRVPEEPHSRRARVGPPGRLRDGARLPAPPAPGTAGLRTDRLRENV